MSDFFKISGAVPAHMSFGREQEINPAAFGIRTGPLILTAAELAERLESMPPEWAAASLRQPSG